MNKILSHFIPDTVEGRVLKEGHPYPLGATWDGEGVNFALFSEHATKVELCLFDLLNQHEIARLPLTQRTNHVWHGYLPGARPGLLYGYRVHGPYQPEQGQRFNPNKLLLDPYAKSIAGRLRWSDAHFGYRIGSKRADLSFDTRNDAFGMPKCQVIDPAFTWGNDRPPSIPWQDTVIYEMHVKGFTMQHPEVPPSLRGTYAGLATPPVIDYLQQLGVTAVELLPVQTFFDDRLLLEKGLHNYWGYNTIGFFAPDRRYAATDQPDREFKSMVKSLHSAGIEVILDVVYNHTGEGNQLGPTLSFRGIDNRNYYRLAPDPRYYMDYTGTGNSLNTTSPRVLQLIMDSLRYWVEEMHVDGFRFDLATTLGREQHHFDKQGGFFDILLQDPVLSQVKLVAEPWDCGEGGYQVGNFPAGWSEWNGKYRDGIRRFWKGDETTAGELTYRFMGSPDLYEHGGRGPFASINFVTVHDGFTLQDLVSYNEKHNEANQEGNMDGESNNNSWNCGVEGPTDDSAVNALRARQKRNFLATLFLSQGVPMLHAGDELGHTQMGNNNVYCQDDALSWVNWNLGPEEEDLLAFVRQLIQFRKEHPDFRRRRYFHGRNTIERNLLDIDWFNPDGSEITEEQWVNGWSHTVGMHMPGEPLVEAVEGQAPPYPDNDFLLLFNAYHEDVEFQLPVDVATASWLLVLDTHFPLGVRNTREPWSGEKYTVGARSMVLLARDRRETRRYAP